MHGGVILFGLAFVTCSATAQAGLLRLAVEGPAECESLVLEPLTIGLWAVLLVGGLGVVGLSAYRLLFREDIPVEYHFLLLSALVEATCWPARATSPAWW